MAKKEKTGQVAENGIRSRHEQRRNSP